MSPAVESMSPQAAQVLRQFRVVLNAVKSHFQQVEKQVGIGGAQVWALSVVAQNPGMGTGALAAAMDIQQSTASNLVKVLVNKGLLTSHRDDKDRRAVHLAINTAGLALLAQAPTPWAGVLPDVLVQLDQARLERLSGDLAALIQLLGACADESAATTPLADL
jgi:DNA-binding MarR family transcriptional regulator